MTIEITVRCDGLSCHNSIEIESDNENLVECAGWMVDYDNGFHYCKICKRKIEKDDTGK